jgi:uncharacterized protein (DUF342 family)
MGKEVVAKGKSVKEAVSIALDLLNVYTDEVEIEIIEKDSKGILGIGAKPAVVRVSVREGEIVADSGLDPLPTWESVEKAVESLELPQENPIPTDLSKDIIPMQDGLSGKAWVKDGKIFCKDAPDKYPVISPGTGMKLFKNQVLVEKTAVISEQDALHVELHDEELPPRWELKVSDDKMQAVLHIVPGVRIFRRLKEKPPGNYVQLEVEEKKVPILLDTAPIMEKLQEMGIVHGIDFAEIVRACMSEQAASFVIASGTPPKPGQNGYFLPTQEVMIKKGLKERADGTVDYREIKEFPCVERGQVIGIVKPPVPGIPGTSVTNELVFPPDVYPLVVQEGKGVSLVDGGTKVVAMDAGHPEIKIEGQLAKISVIPKLTIGNDVDLANGNVHYVGDVEILGSVQDGMLVEAQGNVLVRGNVNMAKVFAGSSVIVHKNIIASEITAGSSNLFKAEISNILGELIDQMKQMMGAIYQLSNVSAFKVSSFTRTGLGPLIKILCDGKFKTFPPLARALIDKIRSGAFVLGDEWIEFGERLYRGFITTHASVLESVDDIVRMVKKAEELSLSIENSAADQNCFIQAGFAHNSKMYASGDILILGHGIYNSKLHAEGFIVVDGFVRGGEIYATKGVEIGETGTNGGFSTKIAVPEGETIKIKTAREDTVIQIGQKTHRFTIQASNVYARLNEEGQLKIT